VYAALPADESSVAATAARFIMATVVRRNEALKAKWGEIDLKEAS
jgi:hypothetical protein